jgi:hypothetical protein
MRKTLAALLIILCSAGAIRAQVQVTIESSSSLALSPEGRRALAYKHSQAGASPV